MELGPAKEKIEEESNSPYLWLLVGGSAGSAFLFILAVTVWLYHRRKKAKYLSKHQKLMPDMPIVASQQLCHYKIPPSSYTSSGSDETTDLPYLNPDQPKRPGLMQSASIDVPIQLLTGGDRPIRPHMSRWNSIATAGSFYPSTSIGKVQPDLYRGSDDEDVPSPPCPNGRLWFSLLYDEEEQALKVTLIKAKYLPGRGLNNNPRDPFVRLFLLPDEENYQQSKVRRRTLSPKFQETLQFQISKDDLPDRTLRMSLYDVDKRRVRHSLGHVFISLSRADLISKEVVWKDLENSSQSSSLGELQITLSCNPGSNRLKCVVCKLRNAKGLDSGEAGVYTRVELFHCRKMIKSKKTLEKHQLKEEVLFDEAFSFAVSGRYFDSFSICFTVMVVGPSRLVKDEALGRVVVGPFMYARGEQLLHWQEMLSNPRSLVTRWHGLEEALTKNHILTAENILACTMSFEL